MQPLAYLIRLHEVCQFQTKEGARVGPASNSELRRWLKQGAVQINGIKIKPEDEIKVEHIQSIILFPNNKQARTTLW